MTSGPDRHRFLIPRLMGMMFLQYFTFGSWYVTLSKYLSSPGERGGLGFSPSQTAGIYSTFALGGLVAPLFTGLLADRFFSSERLLSALHLIMASLMMVAGYWCQTHEGRQADPANVYWPLFAIMLVYCIACLASLTLTNVLGFRNLANPKAKFGQVRLIGTFGWIVSGLILSFRFNVISPTPLYLSAVFSLVLSLYALTLPHTPPKGHGRPLGEVVGLSAVKLLRDPSFVVFAIVAFACNAMNQFYAVFSNPYVTQLGIRDPEAVLTLAQWCEMGCMAVVPFLLLRYGLKFVMLLGLIGWVIRNGLLWQGDVNLIVAISIPMHGVSYAFFGMVGSMFVDREAPPHLRAGAQALVMIVTNGPALLLGNTVAGLMVTKYTHDGVTDWSPVWLISTIGYLFALAIFVLFLRAPPEQTSNP
ncbi:MAG: MFS transporter [Gemmataceae bacterium]